MTKSKKPLIKISPNEIHETPKMEDGTEVPHPIYRWYWERDENGKIIPESEIYERIR